MKVTATDLNRAYCAAATAVRQDDSVIAGLCVQALKYDSDPYIGKAINHLAEVRRANWLEMSALGREAAALEERAA